MKFIIFSHNEISYSSSSSPWWSQIVCWTMGLKVLFSNYSGSIPYSFQSFFLSFVLTSGLKFEAMAIFICFWSFYSKYSSAPSIGSLNNCSKFGPKICVSVFLLLWPLKVSYPVKSRSSQTIEYLGTSLRLRLSFT